MTRMPGLLVAVLLVACPARAQAHVATTAPGATPPADLSTADQSPTAQPTATQPTAAHAPAPADSTCITCHLEETDELAAPIAEWRDSVHGRAGVGCEGCHGGDLVDQQIAHSPTAHFVGRPRLREVAYMCGKCHAEIRDRHIGSVHGANGLPHCVTCHGAHAVTAPDPQAIITEEACKTCHPFDRAQTAQEMLGKARELLADLEVFEDQVQHLPGVVRPLEALQKELRLDRAGIVQTFHSFRIGDIQQIGANADRVMKTVTQLREREELREANYAAERPVILLLMGFFALCAAFGYCVYHGKDGALATSTPTTANDHG